MSYPFLHNSSFGGGSQCWVFPLASKNSHSFIPNDGCLNILGERSYCKKQRKMGLEGAKFRESYKRKEGETEEERLIFLHPFPVPATARSTSQLNQLLTVACTSDPTPPNCPGPICNFTGTSFACVSPPTNQRLHISQPAVIPSLPYACQALRPASPLFVSIRQLF